MNAWLLSLHGLGFQYVPFHQCPFFNFCFHAGCRFINDEWQASAISITITYLVFVMGIPALIFQTFIPDGLRQMYNERIKQDWGRFKRLVIAVFVIFILSNPFFEKVFSGFFGTLICALIETTIVVWVLYTGGRYFSSQFRNTRDIEGKLSEKIATEASTNILADNKIAIRKDLEDLAVLGKEISPGTKKTFFLKQCEQLIENLLKSKLHDPHVIGELLQDVVCASVNTEKGQLNRNNTEEALNILTLAYDLAFGNGNENAYPYLKAEISSCIREIAVNAVSNDDDITVETALDKLSRIGAPSHVLYALGSTALAQKHTRTALTVATTLRDKVRDQVEINPASPDDKQLFTSWLGLLAKIRKEGERGAADEFANRELFLVHPQPETLRVWFAQARDHFFHRSGDFSTVDALRAFEQAHFSKDN